MRLFKNRAAVGLLVVGSLIPLTFAGSVVAAGPPAVGMGTADAYGVLAGDSITNLGATTINGNLGLHPGSSVTGAPTVVGVSNVAKDDGAPASLGIASGLTLTLQGDASSVWIFQSASTLIAETGSRVVLSGGAQACNVFWQVSSSATLKTGATFVGTVMANTSISVQNSVTVAGRLLAGAQANGGGALTLDTDTITRTRLGVLRSMRPAAGVRTRAPLPLSATALAILAATLTTGPAPAGGTSTVARTQELAVFVRGQTAAPAGSARPGRGSPRRPGISWSTSRSGD